MLLAFALVAASLEARSSGKGQIVDCAPIRERPHCLTIRGAIFGSLPYRFHG